MKRYFPDDGSWKFWGMFWGFFCDFLLTADTKQAGLKDQVMDPMYFNHGSVDMDGSISLILAEVNETCR